MLPHLPLLRAGRPYRSLAVERLRDVRTGAPVAEVSQATAGMIARDLRDPASLRRPLDELTVAQLVALCRRAGELFAGAELPLGDGRQGPEDYLRQLAATTGLPLALGRANMGKITRVLTEMEEVLGGLTRGLDLTVLDAGWGAQGARKLSYLRQSDTLGAVLPNNSPGVHSLWLPALALKTALVLKPGSTEPWTPYRVAQAFLAAGCPPPALSFYPGDHAAGNQVLLRCGRCLVFGDAATVVRWSGDPRVQPHGPGWSKVLLAADQVPRWRDHLELMAESVAANGGRSCINASGIWLPAPGPGRALAEALAERLATVEPRPLDHPEARLAAFASPQVARRVSQLIDQHLQQEGAEDVSARLYPGGRVAEVDGCTFLRPTVIHVTDPGHPLAAAEFVFPFVAVVEVPAEQLFTAIGPTLVATVLTADPAVAAAALACPHVDRLNLGAIATPRISWDQPHEGSLFEHLYRQRAFQAASA